MIKKNKMLIVVVFLFILILTVILLCFCWCKKSKPVIILQNYNEQGGFFWQMFNVLNMLHLSKQYNLKPVVLFDTGLYFEKRPEFIRNIPTYDAKNWFNHFFKATNASDKSDMYWLKYIKENKVPIFNNKSNAKVMMFNRETLKKMRFQKDRNEVFSKLWKTHIKVQPCILQKVDAFKRQHSFDQKHVIGIHFRGTDKLPSKAGNEDNPIHYEYSFCSKLIQTYIEKHNLTKETALIFIATDEEPFVKFMQNTSDFYDIKVCFTNSTRSEISTSGLNIDTSNCKQGINDSDECAKYNKLILTSIHRGHPEVNKYKKGEDVLIDVLLLTASHVFFRSRGNVSNFVEYINPQLTVIDMVRQHEIFV
jgi:hypothetical protein